MTPKQHASPEKPRFLTYTREDGSIGARFLPSSQGFSTPDDVFNNLVRSLYSWPGLYMIHTNNVGSRTGRQIVTIRASTFGDLGNRDMFVSSESLAYSFAGRVHRVELRYEETRQSAEPDLLLCKRVDA
jgi:hypothetical protein